jgi:exodeoxyribonuclease VII small subunit
MPDAAPQTFEAKLARIEEIRRELEGGSVELLRATELFKEGKLLAAQCEALLKSAQEQIDRATRDEPPAPASG